MQEKKKGVKQRKVGTRGFYSLSNIFTNIRELGPFWFENKTLTIYLCDLFTSIVISEIFTCIILTRKSMLNVSESIIKFECTRTEIQT